MSDPKRAATWHRFVLIAAAILLLVAGLATDLRNSLLNPQDTGPLTALYVALVFALFGGVGLPPVVMILPVAAFWPLPAALAICHFGGLGAAVAGFLISRHLIGASLARRIPARLLRYERRMETHGFSTVILLRLLFYLFPPVNWLLGASGIRLLTFTLATALGALPGTAIMVWTGHGVIPYLLELPPPALAGIAAGIVLLLIWWWKVLLPR
jgi:uncharacterized membrane protein YdjX (TVP38/TMEM64 family)